MHLGRQAPTESARTPCELEAALLGGHRHSKCQVNGVTGPECNQISSSQLQASLDQSSGSRVAEVANCNPGMRDPTAWWLAAQQALLDDLQRGSVPTAALALLLQRTVQVYRQPRSAVTVS